MARMRTSRPSGAIDVARAHVSRSSGWATERPGGRGPDGDVDVDVPQVEPKVVRGRGPPSSGASSAVAVAAGPHRTGLRNGLRNGRRTCRRGDRRTTS
jgi:hypothetical protein